MPILYPYRIFISHAWKYGDDYNRLVNMLDKAPNFIYRNYSAPKEKPLFPEGTPMTNSKIAEKIVDKIRPCQIVIVISGMYSAHREWMKFEVDTALKLNKPILAIRPWSQMLIPQDIREKSDDLVSWNTQSIVDAIRRLVP